MVNSKFISKKISEESNNGKRKLNKVEEKKFESEIKTEPHTSVSASHFLFVR